MVKDLGVKSEKEFFDKLDKHESKLNEKLAKISNIEIKDESGVIQKVYKVKYPDIQVQLTGQNGNAFVLLGVCQREMKNAKCTPQQIKEFLDEATNGDYDHLLQTCMRYFDVC